MKPEQHDLEQRMLHFGVNTIKYCYSITQPLEQSIVSQLVRSATSIGANYTEANNASSRADFRNKVFIAKKEASEARYWLKMLGELESENVERLILEKEAHELIMILQKIVNTLKIGAKIAN